MKKYVLIACSFATLCFTACTTDEVVPEEPDVQVSNGQAGEAATVAGLTLHALSCEEAKSRVESYGSWIGENMCDVNAEVPRYWDIDVAEMQAVLDRCYNPNNDGKFRVYLGRHAFDPNEPSIKMIDLLLVPIIEGATRNGRVEDMAHIHDLISPCPSTCGGAPSQLEFSFFEGVHSNSNCEGNNVATPYSCNE